MTTALDIIFAISVISFILCFYIVVGKERRDHQRTREALGRALDAQRRCVSCPKPPGSDHALQAKDDKIQTLTDTVTAHKKCLTALTDFFITKLEESPHQDADLNDKLIDTADRYKTVVVESWFSSGGKP